MRGLLIVVALIGLLQGCAALDRDPRGVWWGFDKPALDWRQDQFRLQPWSKRLEL